MNIQRSKYKRDHFVQLTIIIAADVILGIKGGVYKENLILKMHQNSARITANYGMARLLPATLQNSSSKFVDLRCVGCRF